MVAEGILVPGKQWIRLTLLLDRAPVPADSYCVMVCPAAGAHSTFLPHKLFQVGLPPLQVALDVVSGNIVFSRMSQYTLTKPVAGRPIAHAVAHCLPSCDCLVHLKDSQGIVALPATSESSRRPTLTPAAPIWRAPIVAG